MKSKKQKNNIKAFTIIELLIVIVIIGILAAITIVSYTGITSRANQTTIISDLTTAKKQFELYKVDHGVYPTGLENGTNCLTGTISPSPDTRYCLKSTSGSAYTLEDATGSDYTLKLIKGTVSYKVTKDLAPTSTTAAVTAASFVKTWGGSGGDYGYSVAQTGDGGHVVTGQTTIYIPGGNDMFISKYDSSGSLLWNKTWGSAGSDVGYSIIKATDESYVVAGITSFGAGNYDVFINKYDSNGNLLWNKTWGGAGSDQASDLILSNDGGYVVTGQTSNYGAGGVDSILLKYDSNGNLLWNKTWGGSNTDYGRRVTQSSDDGYIVVGDTVSYGSGAWDAFIVKYNSNGSYAWNKTWGGATSDGGAGIASSDDGGCIIIGNSGSYSVGANDMFLAKYDNSGNLIWSKTWGGASEDVGQAIHKTLDNGYIVEGYTTSYGAGINDVFIVKYDLNGNMLWNKTWGGANSEQGSSIVPVNSGGYIMVGYTLSYGAGSTDAIVIKIKADGTMNNCSSPMCQTPTATITTPSATVTTPSATISSPTATVTAPTATVSSPTATETTVVAP